MNSSGRVDLKEVERMRAMIAAEPDKWIQKQLKRTLARMLDPEGSERQRRNFITYPPLAIFYVAAILTIGLIIADAVGIRKVERWSAGLLWGGLALELVAIVKIIFSSQFPAASRESGAPSPPTPKGKS